MSVPRHQVYHQNHLQHGSCISSRPDTTIADARDQEQQDLMHLSLDLPITYMPFKFENRRVRIDWRLLHGVDIDKLVSPLRTATPAGATTAAAAVRWCCALCLALRLFLQCDNSCRPLALASACSFWSLVLAWVMSTPGLDQQYYPA